MKKNYLSELHTSFNSQGYPYVILNVNEFAAVKDNNSLSRFFTDQELKQIIGRSLSTRILIQDAEKIVYKAEDYASVQKYSLSLSDNISTYVIDFNRDMTYPVKIIFEHSYRLNLYSHLKEKMKNINFLNSLPNTEDAQILFNQIVEHEESLLQYHNTERTKIIFETRDIDTKKFRDVKERVNFASNTREANSLIQNYSTGDDGFTIFSSIIVNNVANRIGFENNDSLVDFYSKLINTKNDFDYKRYLFTKGIYSTKEEKKETSTSPQDVRTNTTNVSAFSEDAIFKLDDTSLKTSTSNNSANLFLMFILMNDEIVKPNNSSEVDQYNSFLQDPFSYPSYFFRNVLKFKLEYLSSISEDSLYETWEEVNTNNIPQLLNQRFICRVNLKNKKYYDRLAYEYFIVGV